MAALRAKISAVLLVALFAAVPAPGQVVTASDSTSREVAHTVKPGDTLWDLARQYLNDPYRWPEVFHRNPDVVENPHLIYPGEVIRIPAAAVRAEALSDAERSGTVVSTVQTRSAQGGTNTVFGQPVLGGPSTRLEVTQRASGGTVRRGEVDAAPFVVSGRRRDRRFEGRITGSAERPGIEMDVRASRFQLNDQVYISTNGRPPIGARFTALAYGPQVMDSAQLMIPTAILRVEEVTPGRPVLARVIRQFDEILVEQPIVVYGGETGVSGSAVPFAGSLEGRVVWVHDDPVLPSLQHYVFIVTGRAAARVGDRFGLVDQTTRGASDPTRPPEWAALAQVVRVTPFAATAIIIDHDLPTITTGMRARLTARVP